MRSTSRRVIDRDTGIEALSGAVMIGIADTGTLRAPHLVMFKKSDELKDRIEARKHELMSKYNELKADSRAEASTRRDSIKARLSELEDTLKDGWDNVSESVAGKLNGWLEKKD
jgi:hypothetical protein